MSMAMKRLFEEFDQVRIINLRERTDRRAGVLKELARIGLDEIAPPLSFYTAERPAPVAAGEYAPKGSLISHREAIREALAAGAGSLLIIEDDVFFTDPPAGAVDDIIGAMRRTDWEIVYFGRLPEEGEPSSAPLNLWPKGVIGGHFYGMTRGYMEKILAYLDSLGKPELGMGDMRPTFRDSAFGLYAEGHPDLKQYLAGPNLALQRSSRTDLHKLAVYDRIPGVKNLVGAARNLRNSMRKRQAK